MKVGFTVDAIEANRLIEAMNDKVYFGDETMKTLGVEVNPIIDGKFHRFALPNSRKMNGWYVLSQDEYGTIFGSYGDWSSSNMKSIKFCSKKLLTEAEVLSQNIRMKQMSEEHDAEEKAQREWLLDVWPDLSKAYEHPYLERKGVGIHCDMRLMDGALCIPMMDKDGNLASMQRILPDGKKLFTKHLSTKGVRLTLKGDQRVFLCEGYATGASIHEATGATVIVCFNAGNLIPVSADYPGATIVADNDASHTGEDAAKKTGLKYILIPDEGMDANDYAQKYGINALRAILLPETTNAWSVPLNDWLGEPQPLSWLIKGWIPRNSTVTCFGASGSGKTFVLLDMMLCITTGQETWHGAKVHKGNVFYMCGEGYAGMRGRAKAWAMENGISDLGNINITQSAKDLINSNDLQTAIEEIDSLPWKPDLITIDTLNRFYSGDENAADKIHLLLDSVQTLQRRYQCAILIIHHTGVSNEAQTRARGSSALKAAMDVEFSVERSEENTILVTQRKQKDIEFLDPMEFSLKSVDLGWVDEDGDPVTSAVLEWNESTNSITIDFSSEDEAWLFLKDNFCRRNGVEKTGFGWKIPSASMKKFAAEWLRTHGDKVPEEDLLKNQLLPKSKLMKLLSGTVRSLERGYYEVSFTKKGFCDNEP